jgi:hypothetical protein
VEKYCSDQIAQAKLFRIRLHEYLFANVIAGMAFEVVAQ